MSGNWRLSAVRLVHTVIYGVMASACLLVLYAGLTGTAGRWLPIALGLVLVEAAVFVFSGLRCPLTALAVRYGASRDGAYDTCMPERITRYTAVVFGPIMVAGVALLVIRWIVASR